MPRHVRRNAITSFIKWTSGGNAFVCVAPGHTEGTLIINLAIAGSSTFDQPMARDYQISDVTIDNNTGAALMPPFIGRRFKSQQELEQLSSAMLAAYVMIFF